MLRDAAPDGDPLKDKPLAAIRKSHAYVLSHDHGISRNDRRKRDGGGKQIEG